MRAIKRLGDFSRLRTASLAIAATMLLGAPSAMSVDQSPTEKSCSDNMAKDYVTHIGWIEEDFVKLLTGDGRQESLSAQRPNALLRHFRIRVNVYGEQPKDWRLTLYDEKIQHASQIMAKQDFERGATMWSKRLDGGRAKAVLQSRGASSPFLRINGLISVAKEAKVAYYSVQNRDAVQWQCLSCPTIREHQDICDAERILCTDTSVDQRRLGESVGMVMVFGAKAAWTCSGFHVAPGLFLTNWHCGGSTLASDSYWDDDTLRNLIIDFSWDGDDLSNEFGWSNTEVVPGKSVVTDRDLDFAIFRIRPLLQTIGLPPIATLENAAPIVEDAPLRIVHHPLSRVKHLTKRECRVVAADHPSWFTSKPGVDFKHECDTEGGSSGAPVFDERGYVVGVHHSGHTLDPAGNCDNKNKAVKISRILDSLPASLKDEILHAQR
jgi:hypothetical protein